MTNHAIKDALGPGLVSVRSRTIVRANAEDIASLLLDRVCAAHPEVSNRNLAGRFGVNECMIRGYRDGSKTVPFALPFVMPREMGAELFTAAHDELELPVSGVPIESAHRKLVAMQGEFASRLDEYLADGRLSDDERADLAHRLRQHAARAEQAARDLTGTR